MLPHKANLADSVLLSSNQCRLRHHKSCVSSVVSILCPLNMYSFDLFSGLEFCIDDIPLALLKSLQRHSSPSIQAECTRRLAIAVESELSLERAFEQTRSFMAMCHPDAELLLLGDIAVLAMRVFGTDKGYIDRYSDNFPYSDILLEPSMKMLPRDEAERVVSRFLRRNPNSPKALEYAMELCSNDAIPVLFDRLWKLNPVSEKLLGKAIEMHASGTLLTSRYICLLTERIAYLPLDVSAWNLLSHVITLEDFDFPSWWLERFFDVHVQEPVDVVVVKLQVSNHIFGVGNAYSCYWASRKDS